MQPFGIFFRPCGNEVLSRTDHLNSINYMKKQLNLFLLLLLSGGFCMACWKSDNLESPRVSNTKTGYKPIYIATELVYKVTVQSPQKLKNPGKIYIKDNYLFVNEVGKGIHVFDNTDKTKPVALSFIAIQGNIDIAVKGTTLYADNLTDMVAIDISNPANARVVKRLPSTFPNVVKAYPDVLDTYFECVDPSKGTVVGWEKITLDPNHLPDCFRY